MTLMTAFDPSQNTSCRGRQKLQTDFSCIGGARGAEPLRL